MMLRLGTRRTALALAQAEEISMLLAKRGVQVRIEMLVTEGDHILGNIAENGGKGVFVKAIESALLCGKIDVAVHSYKDMPFLETDGLVVAAVPVRRDARDVLVLRSTEKEKLDNMVIGTCSLRRRYQLQKLLPGVFIKDIRGSVLTRLRKMEEGFYDGLILAKAGLERLDQISRIHQIFSVDSVVPAVGQGALALQCRQDDGATSNILRLVNDVHSEKVLRCERAFIRHIEGDCHTPVGGYLDLENTQPIFYGFLADAQGRRTAFIRKIFDPQRDAVTQGYVYAKELKSLLGETALMCGR